MTPDQKIFLTDAFETAINKVSAENNSNTPDFILAKYLVKCLENFDEITNKRNDWYKPTETIKT